MENRKIVAYRIFRIHMYRLSEMPHFNLDIAFEEFVIAVNREIEKGWQPLGRAIFPNEVEGYFIQTLVKYSTEQDKD